MDGKDGKKTNIANSYKGYEVVDSYDNLLKEQDVWKTEEHM